MTLLQKMGIKLHLLLCLACARFSKQLKILGEVRKQQLGQKTLASTTHTELLEKKIIAEMTNKKSSS